MAGVEGCNFYRLGLLDHYKPLANVDHRYRTLFLSNLSAPHWGD